MTADATGMRSRSIWERRLSRASIIAGSSSITREDVLWFVSVFSLSLLGGVWLVQVADVFVGDAIARAANAHHAVLSRDPHLAAIGFIWPPLPSFLEIPLVLALRPFGLALLAPQVLTAAFTAALAVLLNRTFLLLRVGDWRRWLLTAAVLLNPLVAFAAINGMTENIFMFFVVGSVYYLLVWLERSVTTLIIAGVMVGLSFFVRYEGLALGAGGVLALLLITRVEAERDRSEALLIAFLGPLALAILLWSFWSALFVGDPLYFLRAVGSNEFYTGGIREAGATTEMGRAYHDIAGTALFSLRRLWSIYPLFLPAVIVATWMAVRHRDRPLAMVLAVACALPAFSVLQVFRGELFEWVRFWQSLVIFGPLLAAGALRHLHVRSRRHALLGVVVAAFASSVLTAVTMGGSVASPDERQFIGVVSGNLVGDAENANATILEGLREAAGAIDALPASDGEPPLIAIDTFVHPALVLLVEHPASLVIASDRDFTERLESVRSSVDYLLLPEPVGISADTDLSLQFPGVYHSGSPFMTLVEEFDQLSGHGNARLYRVHGEGPP